MARDLPDLWATRDYPVLGLVAEMLEVEYEPAVDATMIAGRSDFSYQEADHALLALYDSGYVGGQPQDDATARHVLVESLTEAGRRAAKIWPDAADVGAALIEALERAADQEPDPEKKSRLRQMAQTGRSVGEGIVGSIIANVILKTGGM